MTLYEQIIETYDIHDAGPIYRSQRFSFKLFTTKIHSTKINNFDEMN